MPRMPELLFSPIPPFAHSPTQRVSRQSQSPSRLVVDLDLHSQQGGAERFALSIRPQRDRPATAEGVMQQKIQRAQIGQFVSLDLAVADALKMPLHALRRDVLDQQRIAFRFVGDEANIRRVAFITGARMSQFEKLNFRHLYDSRVSIDGWASVFGSKAGQ